MSCANTLRTNAGRPSHTRVGADCPFDRGHPCGLYRDDEAGGEVVEGRGQLGLVAMGVVEGRWRIAGETRSGQPPRKTKARTLGAVQSGNAYVHNASANGNSEARSTVTKDSGGGGSKSRSGQGPRSASAGSWSIAASTWASLRRSLAAQPGTACGNGALQTLAAGRRVTLSHALSCVRLRKIGYVRINFSGGIDEGRGSRAPGDQAARRHAEKPAAPGAQWSVGDCRPRASVDTLDADRRHMQ